MSGTDLKRLAYKLLDMPADDDGQAVEIGEFCPADSPLLVQEIARRRLAQLMQALQIEGLHPQNREWIRSQLFHTYEDFILQTRRETPTRTQDLPTGHSLGRSGFGAASQLVAYLEYLKKHAPDLAVFFYRKIKARIPDFERERHSYILGKSGSGKTELLKLLLHSYLRRSNPVTLVVIDPHGDFAEQVARWKENRDGTGLVYVDPFLDKSGKRVPTLNPFALKKPTPHSVDVTAQALLGAFKEILRNASLTNQMEALLIPCLSVLLNRKGSTLADLMRFMDDNANADLVSLGTKADNPAHAKFFASGAFFRTTYNTTKASLATKLQSLLNSQTFYNLTVGTNTLDIARLLNSRKLVVFNLAKGRLGFDTSEAYGRFVLALMQAAVLQRQTIHASQRVPVHCFIDEFSNYVSESMAEILAESRKYKLHLTLAQQYLGQGMDTDFKRAVLANTQIKITGLNSNDTRAALTKEMEVASDDLAHLKIGQFWVKVGSRPAWKLYAPHFLLGSRNAMSATDWQTVKADQLARYYREITADLPAVDDMPPKLGNGEIRGLGNNINRTSNLPSKQENLPDIIDLEAERKARKDKSKPPKPTPKLRPKFRFEDEDDTDT